ncbi:MAG: hypothetical protein IPG68_16275 [Micrococcales bacterium]|nr:hypothetical protein [Micrococcales bacterium]
MALRGTGNTAVLLARFANTALQETVTVAQVFWFGRPCTSRHASTRCRARRWSITGDFDVGSDLSNLRRHLRERDTTMHDSFSKVQRRLPAPPGDHHPQALELFHQTVSMKSVGNLTEFARTHMLEPADVDARIEALIKHLRT